MTNLTELITNTPNTNEELARVKQSPLARLECETNCPSHCDKQADIIKELQNAPPDDN